MEKWPYKKKVWAVKKDIYKVCKCRIRQKKKKVAEKKLEFDVLGRRIKQVETAVA